MQVFQNVVQICNQCCLNILFFFIAMLRICSLHILINSELHGVVSKGNLLLVTSNYFDNEFIQYRLFIVFVLFCAYIAQRCNAILTNPGIMKLLTDKCFCRLVTSYNFEMTMNFTQSLRIRAPNPLEGGISRWNVKDRANRGYSKPR
mmetsp:Transcript_20791/g.21102  ORF Transcript_20791/g.21102 Transcript_20791/m.21102 type:complete len:147 (-) Transcript_20791:1106-1546(-)